MSKENIDSSKDGSLYITFNSYLDRLRAEEGAKPPAQRRQVPTIRELARLIRERNKVELHEATLMNLINDNRPLLNKETARMLLNEMWYLGFEPTESDFIKYVPPQKIES